MISHSERIQEYDNLGLELVRLLKAVADIYTEMQLENRFHDDDSLNALVSAIQDCMDNLTSFEEFLDRICVLGN